jgi:hypothetical protein
MYDLCVCMYLFIQYVVSMYVSLSYLSMHLHVLFKSQRKNTLIVRIMIVHVVYMHVCNYTRKSFVLCLVLFLQIHEQSFYSTKLQKVTT